MKASTFRLIERGALMVTGFALGSVGGLAILLKNLTLGATFVVAALAWLPFLLPHVVDRIFVDRAALEPWVEVDRTRFEKSTLLAGADGVKSGAEEAVRGDGDHQLAGNRPGRTG